MQAPEQPAHPDETVDLSDASASKSGMFEGARGENLEQPGDQIGPYKLLVQLGEGGFGVVWLAERREPFVQQVALKVIKAGMDSKAVIARFEQERQALALMNHPHVAKVLDGGMTPAGRPYFAMEFVKGEPITDFCDKHKLTIKDRLRLFLQVCEAIQHAHTKGIIHRDLKPGNVLVGMSEGDQPNAKVIDFGVAKALTQRMTEKTVFTETGQMIGTPLYMSPEQADPSDQDIDTRSDVYSLGVILYELLTGTTPFDLQDLRSRAYREVQRMIREQEPPSPSARLNTIATKDAALATQISAARQEMTRNLTKRLRSELEWIPLKAMRKERSERYDSPAALAEDVERYLRGAVLVAGPVTLRYRVGKWLARHELGTAWFLLGAGFLLVPLELHPPGFTPRDAALTHLAQAIWSQMPALIPLFAAGSVSSLGIFMLWSRVLLRNQCSALTRVTIGAACAVGLDVLSVLALAGLRGIAEIGTRIDSGADMASDLFLTSTLSVVAAILALLVLSLLPLVAARVMRFRWWLGYALAGLTIGSAVAVESAKAAYFEWSSLQSERRDVAECLVGASLFGVLAVPSEDAADLERTIAAAERSIGPDHPDTIVLGVMRGRALLHQGKPAEAEACAREAFQCAFRLLGETHPDTSRAAAALGLILEASSKPAEAEPLLRSALARMDREELGGRMDFHAARASLAKLLGDAKRFHEIIDLLEPSPPERFTDERFWLVLAYMSLPFDRDRFIRAEAELIHVYERDDRNAKVREAAGGLVTLHTRWNTAEPGTGHDVKAAEWKLKVDKIKAAESSKATTEAKMTDDS